MELTNKYVLENPLHPDTTSGLVVHECLAALVREKVAQAISKGAVN